MTHSCHYRLRALFAAAFLLFSVPALAVFTDHGDGTVTDTVTGLMWDKCTWGQSDNGCATGAATTHTWAAALGVAVTANAANYKGYDDWRLPNRTELESLVDITASSPAIDGAAFPNTPSGRYWTSTTYAPDPAFAWSVHFYVGNPNARNKTSTDHVRLVRSGQSFDALAVSSHTVTPSAGAGGGISPNTPQTVNHDDTTQFTVTPDPGYTASVGGTCGGSLVGDTYTTNAITGDCTVEASFALEAVNGACGAADGVATLTAPVADLCDAGTAGTVTTADGQHAWMCTGSGGGSDAACAAPGADAGAGDIGGSGNATLTLDPGAGCTVDSANLVAPPAGGPAGVDMPFGALDFTLTGCTGGSATLTVSYSGSVEGMDYWKYIDGAWTTMPATLSDNTATFTIVDNGPYDADPAVGTIRDPSGVGLTSTPAPGTVTPIPTLSEWAMILLSLLMAGIAFVMMRRRV